MICIGNFVFTSEISMTGGGAPPIFFFIRQIVIDVGNYYWYGELLFTWVMVMITLKASPLP